MKVALFGKRHNNIAMELASQDIVRFRKTILSWWKTNKRDLPWRHTHNPYKILVSEVMLQQTQVSRVLVKYREFLDIFPTVEVLAKASPATVLRIWKGMGYNRRALYLQKCAQIIQKEYKGIFPKTEKELIQLPGLGIYTARAILVFAYKQDVAAVDTNVRQIIQHFFFKNTETSSKSIQIAADRLVPKGKSWEWHQALMDYGAIEMPKLRIKKPKKISAIPFRQTNRFFRGRIIDLLREKEMNKQELLDIMERVYDQTQDFIEQILLGLAKDGLIEVERNYISLPK